MGYMVTRNTPRRACSVSGAGASKAPLASKNASSSDPRPGGCEFPREPGSCSSTELGGPGTGRRGWSASRPRRCFRTMASGNYSPKSVTEQFSKASLPSCRPSRKRLNIVAQLILRDGEDRLCCPPCEGAELLDLGWATGVPKAFTPFSCGLCIEVPFRMAWPWAGKRLLTSLLLARWSLEPSR